MRAAARSLEIATLVQKPIRKRLSRGSQYFGGGAGPRMLIVDVTEIWSCPWTINFSSTGKGAAELTVRTETGELACPTRHERALNNVDSTRFLRGSASKGSSLGYISTCRAASSCSRLDPVDGPSPELQEYPMASGDCACCRSYLRVRPANWRWLVAVETGRMLGHLARSSADRVA